MSGSGERGQRRRFRRRGGASNAEGDVDSSTSGGGRNGGRGRGERRRGRGRRRGGRGGSRGREGERDGAAQTTAPPDNDGANTKEEIKDADGRHKETSHEERRPAPERPTTRTEIIREADLVAERPYSPEYPATHWVELSVVRKYTDAEEQEMAEPPRAYLARYRERMGSLRLVARDELGPLGDGEAEVEIIDDWVRPHAFVVKCLVSGVSGDPGQDGEDMRTEWHYAAPTALSRREWVADIRRAIATVSSTGTLTKSARFQG
jgi:hypothetical protein